MKAIKPTFPLNAWYAAAYDVEVARKLLARTVCNQKIVMFRKLDGSVVVLEDALLASTHAAVLGAFGWR